MLLSINTIIAFWDFGNTLTVIFHILAGIILIVMFRNQEKLRAWEDRKIAEFKEKHFNKDKRSGEI